MVMRYDEDLNSIFDVAGRLFLFPTISDDFETFFVNNQGLAEQTLKLYQEKEASTSASLGDLETVEIEGYESSVASFPEPKVRVARPAEFSESQLQSNSSEEEVRQERFGKQPSTLGLDSNWLKPNSQRETGSRSPKNKLASFHSESNNSQLKSSNCMPESLGDFLPLNLGKSQVSRQEINQAIDDIRAISKDVKKSYSRQVLIEKKGSKQQTDSLMAESCLETLEAEKPLNNCDEKAVAEVEKQSISSNESFEKSKEVRKSKSDATSKRNANSAQNSDKQETSAKELMNMVDFEVDKMMAEVCVGFPSCRSLQRSATDLPYPSAHKAAQNADSSNQKAGNRSPKQASFAQKSLKEIVRNSERKGTQDEFLNNLKPLSQKSLKQPSRESLKPSSQTITCAAEQTEQLRNDPISVANLSEPSVQKETLRENLPKDNSALQAIEETAEEKQIDTVAEAVEEKFERVELAKRNSKKSFSSIKSQLDLAAQNQDIVKQPSIQNIQSELNQAPPSGQANIQSGESKPPGEQESRTNENEVTKAEQIIKEVHRMGEESAGQIDRTTDNTANNIASITQNVAVENARMESESRTQNVITPKESETGISIAEKTNLEQLTLNTDKATHQTAELCLNQPDLTSDTQIDHAILIAKEGSNQNSLKQVAQFAAEVGASALGNEALNTRNPVYQEAFQIESKNEIEANFQNMRKLTSENTEKQLLFGEESQKEVKVQQPIQSESEIHEKTSNDVSHEVQKQQSYEIADNESESAELTADRDSEAQTTQKHNSSSRFGKIKGETLQIESRLKAQQSTKHRKQKASDKLKEESQPSPHVNFEAPPNEIAIELIIEASKEKGENASYVCNVLPARSESATQKTEAGNKINVTSGQKAKNHATQQKSLDYVDSANASSKFDNVHAPVEQRMHAADSRNHTSRNRRSDKNENAKNGRTEVSLKSIQPIEQSRSAKKQPHFRGAELEEQVNTKRSRTDNAAEFVGKFDPNIAIPPPKLLSKRVINKTKALYTKLNPKPRPMQESITKLAGEPNSEVAHANNQNLQANGLTSNKSVSRTGQQSAYVDGNDNKQRIHSRIEDSKEKRPAPAFKYMKSVKFQNELKQDTYLENYLTGHPHQRSAKKENKRPNFSIKTRPLSKDIIYRPKKKKTQNLFSGNSKLYQNPQFSQVSMFLDFNYRRSRFNMNTPKSNTKMTTNNANPVLDAQEPARSRQLSAQRPQSSVKSKSNRSKSAKYINQHSQTNSATKPQLSAYKLPRLKKIWHKEGNVSQNADQSSENRKVVEIKNVFERLYSSAKKKVKVENEQKSCVQPFNSVSKELRFDMQFAPSAIRNQESVGKLRGLQLYTSTKQSRKRLKSSATRKIMELNSQKINPFVSPYGLKNANDLLLKTFDLEIQLVNPKPTSTAPKGLFQKAYRVVRRSAAFDEPANH